MNIKAIKKIANKISKSYGMPEPIVEKKNACEDGSGYDGIEIRSELPSYEGGNELQDAITKQYPDCVVENFGGCVYFVYKP